MFTFIFSTIAIADVKLLDKKQLELLYGGVIDVIEIYCIDGYKWLIMRNIIVGKTAETIIKQMFQENYGILLPIKCK